MELPEILVLNQCHLHSPCYKDHDQFVICPATKPVSQTHPCPVLCIYNRCDHTILQNTSLGHVLFYFLAFNFQLFIRQAIWRQQPPQILQHRLILRKKCSPCANSLHEHRSPANASSKYNRVPRRFLAVPVTVSHSLKVRAKSTLTERDQTIQVILPTCNIVLVQYSAPCDRCPLFRGIL